MDDDTIKTLRQESRYIRDRLDAIYNIVSEEKERVSKLEIITKDNSKNIDKHLENHWKIVGVAIAIMTIIVAMINTYIRIIGG